MWQSEIISRRVILSPDDIKRKPEDRDLDKTALIDSILCRKLKDSYGDRCIDTGFVNGSTITIVERSIGRLYAEHLNGDIIYDVRFSADVCNPMKGTEVVGTVVNSNKMGLLVRSGPLNIVLARQHHVNRKCFKHINVGDDIPITVVGCRFSYNDREISVIGYLGDVPEYIDESDIEDDDTQTGGTSELDSVATSITEGDDEDESLNSEVF